MATAKQKEAARQNIEKAREVQSARAHGAKIPRQTRGLSTADQDKLSAKDFAFTKERKEPLVDAKHVRNAIARFDQVEGVTDSDRDRPAVLASPTSQRVTGMRGSTDARSGA